MEGKYILKEFFIQIFFSTLAIGNLTSDDINKIKL